MKRRKENLSKHQVKIWRFGDFPTPDLQKFTAIQNRRASARSRILPGI